LDEDVHMSCISCAYALQKDVHKLDEDVHMSTHFRRSKRTPFRENVRKRNITQKQPCYFTEVLPCELYNIYAY